MATGAAWNLDNPLKPWAYFDPNAIRDIPFDWSAWLADIGDTYASHTFVVDAGLTLVTSGQSGGIITARIQASGSPALTVGSKYAVTCRITTTGGQKEDQTLYLKVFEK